MPRIPRFLALLLLLVPLALFARPAAAKLEPAQWTEAEHTFRVLFAQAGEPEKKREAIKAVVKDGEPRAWNLLSEGVILTAAHLYKINEAYAKNLTQLQGFQGSKHSDAEWDVMGRLQSEVSQQEGQRAQEDGVLRALVQTFGDATEDGRKFILAKARGAKEWALRAAAARIAALAPDEASSKLTLAESFAKDSDPRVKVAALDALTTATGTSWHDAVVAAVADADWGVQLLASRLAGEREVGKAIPALITALSTCSPRVGDEIVGALRKLTGQRMDAFPEPWAKWWEANRDKWGADGRPLQPVVSTPRQSDIDMYGLKVKSNRVLFIIDISGSMKLEKKVTPPPAPTPPEKPKGPVTGDDAPMGEPKPSDPKPSDPKKDEPVKPAEPGASLFVGPKIDFARQELKRALQKLPKDAMINIIAFNHAVTQWMPKMVQATDANKELAFAWFRDLQPSGSTYVDGALRLAFKMAGMGAYDKAYPGVGVDTIVLLSDGAPTDSDSRDSKLMDPEEILKHVTEWNSQKRVIIHCVSIDNVYQGIEFMKKLAAQNGGTCIEG